jgi:hypothetical protein
MSAMRSLRTWMDDGGLWFHRGFRMEFLGGANSIWKLACSCAISDGVPRRSLYVALIVGTVLNLINQGDALLGGLPRPMFN